MSASKHEGRQNENIANSSSVAFLKEARTASQDELKVYNIRRDGIPLAGFLNLITVN